MYSHHQNSSDWWPYILEAMGSTSTEWRDRRPPWVVMRAPTRFNLLRPVFFNAININHPPLRLSSKSLDLPKEQLQQRRISLNTSSNHDSMTRMTASTEMPCIFSLLPPHQRYNIFPWNDPRDRRSSSGIESKSSLSRCFQVLKWLVQKCETPSG